MTVTVALTRVGHVRTSESALPLEARLLQGGRLGENILGKQRLTDVEGAKILVRGWLRDVYKRDVAVEWTGAAALSGTAAS